MGLKSGINFEFGPLYLSNEGADKATIWPKDSDVFFAPDGDLNHIFCCVQNANGPFS